MVLAGTIFCARGDVLGGAKGHSSKSGKILLVVVDSGGKVDGRVGGKVSVGRGVLLEVGEGGVPVEMGEGGCVPG